MLITSSPKRLWRSANEFSMFIESKAVEEGTGCYSALLNYCEEMDLEPDAVASLVNKQLKDKLAIEFAEMGLLKKQSSLYD